MNILSLGRLTKGVAVAWNCVKSFLAAKLSGTERHRRRLAKVCATRTNPTVVYSIQLFASREKPRCNSKETVRLKE